MSQSRRLTGTGASVSALVTGLLLGLLAACDNKIEEPVFQEGPKGFVEFYIPAPRPGEAGLNIDTRIYRVEQGQRIFLGMTRKWKGLSEEKRGLTVTLPPGRQDFVITHGEAEARAQLTVTNGGYQRVRIDFAGISHQQLIGATDQMQFRIQATVEP